jgi:hypothetical protein
MRRGIEQGPDEVSAGRDGGAAAEARGHGRDAVPSAPPSLDALAAWVATLAVALVEMAQGMRPVTTLDTVATLGARRRIHRVVGSTLRSTASPRGRVAPVRVLAVRGMQPSAGAYEAAVTVAVGARAIAVAARVEHDGRTWRVVELVPPGTGLLPAGWRAG